MAEYQTLDEQIQRHQHYRSLAEDLRIDFQRRRVASPATYIREGDRVLDVGCNAGYFPKFCPQAREIHGVDASAALVEEARAAGLFTEVHLARAEDLPFPDQSFDVVNISGLLEQVFDPMPVVAECARVARRALVGNVPHERGTWGKHRVPYHEWQARSFSEAELRALLEPFGRLVDLGTVDINRPPEPQCFVFHLEVTH